MSDKKETYLEVESSGKASTTDTTPVSLLGIIGGLAGDISTSTTVKVGEGNVGGKLRLDVIFRDNGTSIKFVLALAGCDSRHGDSGRSSH